MIIVSSWAGNAPVVNCYLWERNGGVRRCSVIWKQFESIVGGTTHCTRRSVLSNPELVLRVHVLSGHWTEYLVDWLNNCVHNETSFYFENLKILIDWLQTLSLDRIWLLTKSSQLRIYTACVILYTAVWHYRPAVFISGLKPVFFEIVFSGILPFQVFDQCITAPFSLLS